MSQNDENGGRIQDSTGSRGGTDWAGEVASSVQTVFDDLRDDMAFRNKLGLAFMFAGIVYWLSMSVTGVFLGPPWNALALLLGTIMIMPLAVFFSRHLGVQPAMHFNPVEYTTRWLLLSQAMYWPIYLVVFFRIPGYLPQTMSLLMVTPFVVLGYLYGSKTYIQVAVLRWVICSVFMVMPRHSFVAVPLLTAATYAYAGLRARREMAVRFG